MSKKHRKDGQEATMVDYVDIDDNGGKKSSTSIIPIGGAERNENLGKNERDATMDEFLDMDDDEEDEN